MAFVNFDGFALMKAVWIFAIWGGSWPGKKEFAGCEVRRGHLPTWTVSISPHLLKGQFDAQIRQMFKTTFSLAFARPCCPWEEEKAQDDGDPFGRTHRPDWVEYRSTKSSWEPVACLTMRLCISLHAGLCLFRRTWARQNTNTNRLILVAY